MVGAVFDGAKALLSTCGGLFSAKLPHIFVLYCVMHRLALVDRHTFHIRKKEVAEPAQWKAKKAFSNVLKAMNALTKAIRKSAKIQDHLEGHASSLGIKLYEFPAMQSTHMLRAGTTAVTCFLLNCPTILHASPLSKLQPKIHKSYDKHRKRLTPQRLAVLVALAEFCWTVRPHSLSSQFVHSTLIMLQGDVKTNTKASAGVEEHEKLPHAYTSH